MRTAGTADPLNVVLTNIATVAAAIVKVGVPATIAIILVVVGAWTLPVMRDELVAMRMATERQAELLRQDVAAHEEIVRELQKICVILAGKNGVEASRCFTH